MKKNVIVLVLLALTVLLSGWSRVWYFVVNNMSDPTHPGFCISQRNNCSGGAVSFSRFLIAEVDERGRYVTVRKLTKPMWIIRPIKSTSLREVFYGHAPEGWEEEGPAKPLQVGKFYTANGEFFFRIAERDGQVQVEVFELGAFMSKFN